MQELEILRGFSGLALLLYLGFLQGTVLSELSTSGHRELSPHVLKNKPPEKRKQLEEMEGNIARDIFFLMFRADFWDTGMHFLINYPCAYPYSFLSGEKEKTKIPTSLETL